MHVRPGLVMGSAAIAILMAASACGDDGDATAKSSGPQGDLPTDIPSEKLLQGCPMTEILSLEIPMLVARGVDPVPSRFDAVNGGTCTFSEPVDRITLQLLRKGEEAFRQTVDLGIPDTQVSLPLRQPPEGTIPENLEPGSYDHRIVARAVDGEEVEVWLNTDGVWVLDSDTLPIDQVREVLRRVRMSLENIPITSPMRNFEPVDWPDTSLGCPEPDTFYAQVITPGFRLVFEDQGQFPEYHTNGDGSLVVTC